MKLGAIFKSVATAVGGPGVGAAVAVATNLINQFKGRDEQLPAGATRPEVEAAYDTLPEAAKAEVDGQLAHELGMEQQHTAQLQALAEADAAGPGASTRPKIAHQMAWLLTIITLLFTAFLFVVLSTDGVAGLDKLSALWPVFGVLTATPVTVVVTYFNARGKEKRTRYAVAHGQPAALSGIAALVSAIRR